MFFIVSGGFFVKWGIDVIGSVNLVTESGLRYILTVTDYCIRWVEAEAVSVITAGVTAVFIYRYIVCFFGCYSELVSD